MYAPAYAGRSRNERKVMNTEEISLVKWPAESRTALDELYAAADQSECLVQMALPLDPERTRSYRRNILRSRTEEGLRFLCCAVMLDGKIAGKIEATAHSEEEAEIDIILRKDCTGRGIGRKAVAAFHEMLKEKHFASSVRAYVSAGNEACIRLLERSGYTRGRRFTADVLIPGAGSYVIREVSGYEYVFSLI